MKMDKELFNQYFIGLIDQVYKILPLYEEENEGLAKFINSLIYELEGLYELHEVVIKDNIGYDFISLMSILEHLSEDAYFRDQEKEVIKREVFKAIGIIKKMCGDAR